MATIRQRRWIAGGEERTAWIADFFNSAGTRRQKTFRRKKDADAWLVQTRPQVAAGTYTPESTSATIGEAIALWLERAKAEGLEYGTQIQYRQHRDHLLKVVDADLKLAKLTQARVEQLRDDLLKRHTRPMAKKILASLKGVLRDAKRRGLVAQNVAADTTIGANGRHRRRLEWGVDLPTTEEVKTILANATNPKARAMILLASLYALRASELRGLPWSALQLDAKPSITISQRADAWAQLGSPKSASSRRTLELDDYTARAFKEWRLAQPPLVTKDENGNETKRPRALVFGTVARRHPGTDRPDMLGNLSDRVLDKAQIGAGITDGVKLDAKGKPVLDKKGNPIPRARYSWHALRHFAITQWIVGGQYDLKDVQQMAGHATLAMTLDTYGHFVPKKDAHARAGDHAAALLA